MEITEEKKCFSCLKLISDTEITRVINDNIYCNDCVYCCDWCEEYHPASENRYFEAEHDRRICAYCVSNTEDICECDNCNRYMQDDANSYSVGIGIICNYCYGENYFRCSNCNESYHNDDWNDDDLCNDCYNDNNDLRISSCYQDYSKDILPNINEKNKRIFACEIESIYENTSNVKNVKDKFAELGIVHDGSLSANGIEYVTPMLSGKRGFNRLKEYLTEISKNHSVDKSCGLHVHLDMKDYLRYANGNNQDYDFGKVKLLFLFSMKIEDIIYSFLPYSRRGNNYCKLLQDFYHFQEISNTDNMEELERIWYREQDYSRKESRKSHKYDNTRYAGINFHSFFSNKNIEIRHHSGTINFDKIYHWVILWSSILDFCSKADSYHINKTILDISRLSNIKEKTKLLFDKIELKGKTKNYLLKRQNYFWKKIESKDDDENK